MQVLRTSRSPRGTVLVFQPQWLEPTDRPQRFPYRALPLLGALLDAGHDVLFHEEAHDGPPAPEWLERDATLAIAWCGEMYPGTQIPGIERFLAVLAAPGAPPRFVGGGFFPLIDVDGLALEGRVDGVVSEPGEIVVPALADAVLAGEPVDDVDGVSSWREGRFRSNPPPPRGPLRAEWYAPLRQLDFARYRHVEPLIFDNDEQALQVATGAGCAKHCPFCFDERSPYGVFPASAILDAVRFVTGERGVEQVMFGELDFFHHRKRARDVVEGLAELRARRPGFRWFALSSVCDLSDWTDAELDGLKTAGCWRIELGVETGSPALLRRLGKRHTVEQALELTERLSSRDVRTTQNLLLGVPDETEEDRRVSLRFADRLASVSPLVRLQPRMYQIVPRTTLGAEALEHLAAVPRTLDELQRYRSDLARRKGALPWLSPADERWVGALIDYVIPMAYERPRPSERSRRRSLLAALARLRCRNGLRVGAGLERRLFERSGAAPLPATFVR